MSANQRDEVYTTPCPGPPVDDRGVLDVRHEASVLAWPERSTRHKKVVGDVTSAVSHTKLVLYISYYTNGSSRSESTWGSVCVRGGGGGGGTVLIFLP